MAANSDSGLAGGQQDIMIPFYVDEQPGLWRDFGNYILYDRYAEQVLGEIVEGQKDERDVRRCFNCGSPEHAVSACPEPLDRQLVALSRQLFEFYKGGNAMDFPRIHELGEWKRQRLQWLEDFEPGLIQGSLLREALGLDDGDIGEYAEWLANIALWGYPKGWVGSVDPRHRVWELIQERAGEGPEFIEAPSLLLIHGEQEGPEEIWLPSGSDQIPAASPNEPHPDGSASPKRWAQYPGTYFSSSLLPVYNGMTLPPVESSFHDSAPLLLPHGEVLQNSTITGTKSDHAALPPPPANTPPPLPQAAVRPPSKPCPSPEPPLHDGEQDMDLSDSESE